MVLEGLETGKGCSSGNQFMAKAGFVLFELVVLVDLLVVVFVFVFARVDQSWFLRNRKVSRMNLPQKPIVTVCCIVEESRCVLV